MRLNRCAGKKNYLTRLRLQTSYLCIVLVLNQFDVLLIPYNPGNYGYLRLKHAKIN